MKEFLKKVWIALNHPVTDGIGGLLIYALGGYILMEYCSGVPHIPSLFVGVIFIISCDCGHSFMRWFFDRLSKKKEA